MSDGKALGFTALGFIETVGLAAAIAAADAALKAANVELIGRENSKGQGCITVKITGDVGAVKAAIDAAQKAAGGVSRVWATDVIPRPAEGLGKLMVWNGETRLDSLPANLVEANLSEANLAEAQPECGVEETLDSEMTNDQEEREEQNVQTEETEHAGESDPIEQLEQIGQSEEAVQGENGKQQAETRPKHGRRGKNTKKHG